MLLMTTTWIIIITGFVTFILTIFLVAVAIRWAFITIIMDILKWFVGLVR